MSIPTASELLRSGWFGDEPPLAYRDTAEVRMLVGIYEMLRMVYEQSGGTPAQAGDPPTRATEWPTGPPPVTPPGKGGAKPRQERRRA